MTNHELNFCKQHDWGTNATLSNGVISGLTDHVVYANGESRIEHKAFDSMDDLLCWAGY